MNFVVAAVMASDAVWAIGNTFEGAKVVHFRAEVVARIERVFEMLEVSMCGVAASLALGCQ